MQAPLCLCILIIFFPHSGILHDETEHDYWEMEQFYQDSVYHFPHKLTDQLPYMRSPGAKCSPTMHFDARIYHHAIRHGLAQVTHRQFIRILNQMCTVIPNFGVNYFYQTLRCSRRRCDCPFDFMTWSNVEKKCKIRVGHVCGDVKVLNTTVYLDDIFGCEDGSKCTQEEDGTSPYTPLDINALDFIDDNITLDDSNTTEDVSTTVTSTDSSSGGPRLKRQNMNGTSESTTSTVSMSTNETTTELSSSTDSSTTEDSSNSTDTTTASSSVSSTTDKNGTSVQARCRCIPGRHCSKLRLRPPNTNRIPPDYPISSGFSSKATSLMIAYFLLGCFLYE